MLKFFNKKSSRGQVAVVLILFITIGLFLYAVSANLNKISSSKIITIKAANRSAAKLASLMASYGEALFAQYLKRQPRYCRRVANWFQSFVDWAFGLVEGAIPDDISDIVVDILQWAVGAMGGDPEAVSGGLFQFLRWKLLLVDPRILEEWNKKQAEMMVPKDRFIEMGVQDALLSSVTDTVEVPDIYDLNLNKKYGWLMVPADLTSAPEYVSRFAIYNSRRLEAIDRDIEDTPEIERFIWTLKNFLYVDDNELNEIPIPLPPPGYVDAGGNPWDGTSLVWGLYDPINCSRDNHVCCDDPPGLAMCDPCCLPGEYDGISLPSLFELPDCCNDNSCEDPGVCSLTIQGRPDWCKDERSADLAAYGCGPGATKEEIEECFTRSCIDRSHYTAGDGDPLNPQNYPWIYSAFYENDDNGIFSLREDLGVDDEHYLYTINPGNPPHGAPQILRTDSPQLDDPLYIKFLQEDAGGIFPFFYKIADWGVDLHDDAGPEDDPFVAHYGTGAGSFAENVQCHLCDDDALDTGDPLVVAYPDSPLAPGSCAPADLPVELAPHLELVYRPGLQEKSEYSGGWCVDKENRPGWQNGEPAQIPDAVPSIPSMIAALDECVIDEYSWKRGSDLFCSTEYPYGSCDKHQLGNCVYTDVDGELQFDCGCGESGEDGAEGSPGNEDLFNEDILDAMGQEIKWFTSTALRILSMDRDVLVAQLDTWYNIIAEWIEPSCPDALCADVDDRSTCDCPWSYTNKSRNGLLFEWRQTLTEFRDDWDAWLLGTSYAQDDVWCVPTAGSEQDNRASRVAGGEWHTFDSNGNGIRGDIEDVLACLDWNINDIVDGIDSAGNPVQAVGNVEKFELCGTECGPENCTKLPRSLIPGVSGFEWTDEMRLLRCAGASNIYECREFCKDIPPALIGGVFFADMTLGAQGTIGALYVNFYPPCASPTSTAVISNTCSGNATSLSCVTALDKSIAIAEDGAYLFNMNNILRCACTFTNAELGSCAYFCDPYRVVDTTFIDAVRSAAGLPTTGEIAQLEACLASTNLYTCSQDCAAPLPGVVEPWVPPENLIEIENLYDPVFGLQATCDSCRPWCPGTPCSTGMVCNGTPMTINCCSSNYLSDIDMCACMYDGGSCDYLCGGDMSYYDAVYAATQPGSTDPCDPAFVTDMLLSAEEARNQLAKFRKRYDFLLARYNEAVAARTLFDTAITRITQFLDGGDLMQTENERNSPSEELIWYMQNKDEEPLLPSTAIYVWRDEMSKTRRPDGSRLGYWHAVKTEVRAPLRCNFSCRVDGLLKENPWPWIEVKLHKHTFSQKLCYYIRNTTGIVKTRVIRADQNEERAGFQFPGGIAVWNLRLTHPLAGEPRPREFVGTDTVPGPCRDLVDPYLLENNVYWKDAFMLNDVPKLLGGNCNLADCPEGEVCLDADVRYCECWVAVHEDLLEYGLVSESCAQYFLGEEWNYGKRGFSLKFISCDDEFLKGNN